MDYIIIQNLLDAGRFPHEMSLALSHGVLPYGIVSTPSPTLVVGAWLGIVLDRRSIGFPRIHLVFQLALRREAAFDSEPLYH